MSWQVVENAEIVKMENNTVEDCANGKYIIRYTVVSIVSAQPLQRQTIY